MKLKDLDLTNKKFTKLLPIEKIRTKGSIYWKCKCDCGKTTLTNHYSILSGEAKSCGCYTRNNLPLISMKEKGRSGFTKVLFYYKRAAKKRNLEFKLTEEQFKKLTNDKCFYCNKKPKQISNNAKSEVGIKNSTYLYNGIDRINNNKGYTLDNCVSCCKMCNMMKMKYGYIEFLWHIRSIYENLKLDNFDIPELKYKLNETKIF